MILNIQISRALAEKDLESTTAMCDPSTCQSANMIISPFLNQKTSNITKVGTTVRHDHTYSKNLLRKNRKNVATIQSSLPISPEREAERALCRTCARLQLDTILVSSTEGTQLSLLTKLNLFTKISDVGNTLPMQICRPCIGELERCTAFVDQIQRAELELNAMLNSLSVNRSVEPWKKTIQENSFISNADSSLTVENTLNLSATMSVEYAPNMASASSNDTSNIQHTPATQGTLVIDTSNVQAILEIKNPPKIDTSETKDVSETRCALTNDTNVMGISEIAAVPMNSSIKVEPTPEIGTTSTTNICVALNSVKLEEISDSKYEAAIDTSKVGDVSEFVGVPMLDGIKVECISENDGTIAINHIIDISDTFLIGTTSNITSSSTPESSDSGIDNVSVADDKSMIDKTLTYEAPVVATTELTIESNIKEEPIDEPATLVEMDIWNVTSDKMSLKLEPGTMETNKVESVSRDSCSAVFSSQEDRNERKQCHGVTRFNFLCEYCSEPFFSAQALQNHRLSEHSLSSVMICEICGKSCADESVLREHQLSDHVRRIVDCAFCDEIFTTESELRYHIEKMHPIIFENRPVATTYCRICMKYVCASSFAHHLKSHQVSPEFKCNVCAKIFQSSASLEHHLFLHGGVCPRCDKKFHNPVQLERHLARHDAVSYACVVCGEAFAVKSKFQAHLRTGDVCASNPFHSFTCNICFVMFSSESTLQDHQKSHTMADQEYFFKQMDECRQCQRVYVTRAYRTIHSMLVHEEGPSNFLCSLCFRWFDDRQSFSKHVMHHKILEDYKQHGNVKTKCGYCVRILARADLHVHTRMLHARWDPPYVCTLCGERVKRIRDFQSHMNMHNGYNMYKCDPREVAFSPYSNRDEHRVAPRENHEAAMHEDPTPLRDERASRSVLPATSSAPTNNRITRKCSMCPEVFYSVHSCKTHVLKFHPESSQAQFFYDKAKRCKERAKNYKFKCSYCYEVLNTYEVGRRHVIKKHPNSEKAVLYKQALERSKMSKKSYKSMCDLCHTTFNSYRQRKNHIMTFHPKSTRAIEYELRLKSRRAREIYRQQQTFRSM